MENRVSPMMQKMRIDQSLRAMEKESTIGHQIYTNIYAGPHDLDAFFMAASVRFALQPRILVHHENRSRQVARNLAFNPAGPISSSSGCRSLQRVGGQSSKQ